MGALCTVVAPGFLQAQSEPFYSEFVREKKLPGYYTDLPKPDTVSVEEMKDGYRKALSRIGMAAWWEQPIREEGNEQLLFSHSLLAECPLLKDKNLVASWYFVSVSAADSVRTFSVCGLWDKATGKPDSLLMERARQLYGRSEAGRRYAGGDVPGRWLTGVHGGIREPMRYFDFIVAPNRIFYMFDKGRSVSYVSERCRSRYYEESRKLFGYMDGRWGGRIDVEMAVLGRDASRACAADPALTEDRTYDLLFTVSADGRLDVVRLAPNVVDERDRHYLNELRTYIRSLPVWSLEHLYTLDGRVFPGRYIQAVRSARAWQLYDYLDKSSKQLYPDKRGDEIKKKLFQQFANVTEGPVK